MSWVASAQVAPSGDDIEANAYGDVSVCHQEAFTEPAGHLTAHRVPPCKEQT